MFTLYNVISKDWFIAKENDSEDFIPDELWTETLRVCGSFDVLVMGRKTYEKIQSYPPELFESLESLSLRKIVISHNPEFIVKGGYEVLTSPEAAQQIGGSLLVSSGPLLNNYLFKQALVDRVILHQVEAELGGGIRVFDEVYNSKLKLELERSVGLVTELIFKVVS